ncbi:MAG: protein kinase, partial [Nitrososphaerales archaeon]
AEGLEVDRRSDLFSFGVVMYEMATGQLPFKGEHDAAILYAIVNEAPLPITTLNPNIPKKLEEFIHKALEKEVEDRYQHADDLAADLRKLKKDIETGRTKTITTQIPVIREQEKRPVWRLPAYVLAVLIVAVLGVIFYSTIFKEPSIPVEDQVDPKSVAVLPFTTITRTEEDEIFTDGIHDDILTQLAKIRDIKVIARTSVMKYRNTDKRISEIGEELGVASVLEGSVRRAGGRIRIVSQLVDVKTDEHLWAETYDRDYSDIFAIQSDVAQKIASALKATLTVEEKSAIEQMPTENLEAYDYYLKGNHYWNTKTTKEGNLKAVEMYEKAIELDRDFALAYARLAIVNITLYDIVSWDHTPARLQLVKSTLDKARELNPDLPDVHFASGVYYLIIEEDYDRAVRECEISLQARPNDSEIVSYMATIFRRQGKWDKAEEYALKAYDLDPRGVNIAWYVSVHYGLMRKWLEAERYINKAIVADPEHGHYHRQKAWIYVKGYGDLERARRAVEDGIRNVGASPFTSIRWSMEVISRNYPEALEVVELDTTYLHRFLRMGLTYMLLEQQKEAESYLDSARMQYEQLISEEPDDDYYHSLLGLVYGGLGVKTKAIGEAQKAVEMVPLAKDAVVGAFRIWSLALTYAIVGEYDLALEQLELLLSIPSSISTWTLKLEPLFDPLRGYPRFQKLVAEG